jgi:hypothetical protein
VFLHRKETIMPSMLAHRKLGLVRTRLSSSVPRGVSLRRHFNIGCNPCTLLIPVFAICCRA